MGGATDAMHDDHENEPTDLAKLRARMVACLNELDELGLPALAAQMDLAITKLDESIRCPEGVSNH